MIELLMYKALFEMSTDRADFVSKLFSRKRPAGLTVTSTAQAMFRAYESGVGDPVLYGQTLKAIKDNLVNQHQFKLSGNDLQKIDYIFSAFLKGGPRMDYTYASASPAAGVPSYTDLMVTTDSRGENWSYLQSEDRYRSVFIRFVPRTTVLRPMSAVPLNWPGRNWE